MLAGFLKVSSSSSVSEDGSREEGRKEGGRCLLPLFCLFVLWEREGVDEVEEDEDKDVKKMTRKRKRDKLFFFFLYFTFSCFLFSSHYTLCTGIDTAMILLFQRLIFLPRTVISLVYILPVLSFLSFFLYLSTSRLRTVSFPTPK